MNEIKLKSCATVANLSCGFDILGLCLNEPYDEITITKTDVKKVVLNILDSKYSDIPKNPSQNTGGVPAELILNDLNLDYGFNIKIKKGIPLCGGLGSSAATSSGVVYGINKILGNQLTDKQMLHYALEGEKVSVSNPHADNIAPCLFGGLSLIRDTETLDIVKIPIEDFSICAIHPDIKINTEYSRQILPSKILLKSAIKQWGEIASLVYAFSSNDISLIRKSMNDYIVEPIRKKLITGFDDIKKQSLNLGALGCGISGSGPTIFALCETKDIAKDIAENAQNYYSSINLNCDIYISKINNNGPIITSSS